MRVGKTYLALDLLEREYFNHFNFIVILYPILRYNATYHQRKWFWTDLYIIQIEPGNHLYDYIEKIGNILAGSKTLFLINHIIVHENLDKGRNSLLDLAMSRRYKGHLLWLLTQSYTAVPLNIRRQVKMLHVWYLKHQKDWVSIHKENDVIEPEELTNTHYETHLRGSVCMP